MKKIVIILLVNILLSCSASKEDLVDAILSNNVKKVQKLVSRGVELFGYSDDEDPTYLICKVKNIELLKALLDGGYIKYIDDEELTYITNIEWAEAIEILIDYGLKPNSMINYGYSLFDWTIVNQKYSITKNILEKGVDINSDLDNDGNTSFITALEFSDIYFLDYLVKECNADLEALYDSDYSVLDYLIYLGDFEKFKFFVDLGVDYTSAREHGYNSWELLGYHWHGEESLKIADYLLEKEVRFNYENSMALHIAAEYHIYDYANWLLDNGFDPYTKDEYGNTADLYTGELVKRYNTLEPDSNNTYEDVVNKADSIDKLIRSYMNK